MMDKILDYLKPSYIDEMWVAYKPWLRNRTHHYMAYVRWFTEPRLKGPRDSTSYHRRSWTFSVAYGSTPEEALDGLMGMVEEKVGRDNGRE